MRKIDRNLGIPPWIQLRDILREAILSGELAGRLPGARQIGQEQDGMAVATVTKALEALRAEGLLTVQKGWGWSVVPPEDRPRPPGG